MNFRFAKDVEIVAKDGNNFLMAKKPLCLIRLNSALTSLLKCIRDDTPWQHSAKKLNILKKITEMGFLESWRDKSVKPSHSPWISVVIPVKDRAEELRRCLASLSSLSYPPEKIEVIVVDDGSRDDSMDIAKNWGAVVIPSGGEGLGPSTARNVGATNANGEILAFIDSDCTASTQWLNQLVPAFSDPQVAAVGGKVEGLNNASSLDRYEATMSSLSLGSRERSAKDGKDTFYLPSCNLLVRKKVFQELRGFNQAMHVGEDVDLSYRLRDKGWRIIYLPEGAIHHEHRNNYISFMARRFDYGTSEAMLQTRHPLRKKRMVVPHFLAAVLFLCLTVPITGAWGMLAALTCLAIDAFFFRKKVKQLDVQIDFTTILAGRIRAFGSLFYYLCFHLVRYYSVVLFILCLFVSQLRPIGLAMLVCTSVVDFAVKTPQLPFLSFFSIYLLEQIAYGTGVLWGSLSHRSFANYRLVMLKQTDIR